MFNLMKSIDAGIVMNMGLPVDVIYMGGYRINDD